jgi:hypothetical protein
MSNPTPPSPKAKTLGLSAVDQISTLEAFDPRPMHARAKARLHARLKERAEATDFRTCSIDELAELAGDRRIGQWFKDPGFVAWLADSEAFAYDALALRETAVAVLADILNSDYEPKILTAKDKLKAADMLLTLTGAYPAKQRDVRFLDASLDGMEPDEVRRELAAVRAKLRELPPEGT